MPLDYNGMIGDLALYDYKNFRLLNNQLLLSELQLLVLMSWTRYTWNILQTEAAKKQAAHLFLVPLLGVLGVHFRGNRFHDDGHESVQATSDLGALPVEHALALDEHVVADDLSRDRVGLEAERRHGP